MKGINSFLPIYFPLQTISITNYKYMKYLIIGGVAGGAMVATVCEEWMNRLRSFFWTRSLCFCMQTGRTPLLYWWYHYPTWQSFVQTPRDLQLALISTSVQNKRLLPFSPKAKRCCTKNLVTNETYSGRIRQAGTIAGAEPIRPWIDGISGNRIFTLRNVPDTDTIKRIYKHN